MTYLPFSFGFFLVFFQRDFRLRDLVSGGFKNKRIKIFVGVLALILLYSIVTLNQANSALAEWAGVKKSTSLALSSANGLVVYLYLVGFLCVWDIFRLRVASVLLLASLPGIYWALFDPIQDLKWVEVTVDGQDYTPLYVSAFGSVATLALALWGKDLNPMKILVKLGLDSKLTPRQHQTKERTVPENAGRALNSWASMGEFIKVAKFSTSRKEVYDGYMKTVAEILENEGSGLSCEVVDLVGSKIKSQSSLQRPKSIQQPNPQDITGFTKSNKQSAYHGDDYFSWIRKSSRTSVVLRVLGLRGSKLSRTTEEVLSAAGGVFNNYLSGRGHLSDANNKIKDGQNQIELLKQAASKQKAQKVKETLEPVTTQKTLSAKPRFRLDSKRVPSFDQFNLEYKTSFEFNHWNTFYFDEKLNVLSTFFLGSNSIGLEFEEEVLLIQTTLDTIIHFYLTRKKSKAYGAELLYESVDALNKVLLGSKRQGAIFDLIFMGICLELDSSTVSYANLGFPGLGVLLSEQSAFLEDTGQRLYDEGRKGFAISEFEVKPGDTLFSCAAGGLKELSNYKLTNLSEFEELRGNLAAIKSKLSRDSEANLQPKSRFELFFKWKQSHLKKTG